MKIRRPMVAPPKGKKSAAKPTVDPVRKRNIEIVQAEMSRLIQVVDEIKQYGSINSLDVAQKILWSATMFLDGRQS